MLRFARQNFVKLVFLAGVVFLMAPVLLLLTYDSRDDFDQMSPEDAVGRASEGVNAWAAPHLTDMQLLEAEAAKGNPVAQNNLALILRRSRGRDNRERSDALLSKAASQGLPQAQYNIAFYLPNRFHTDPQIVKQRLDLLRPLAQAGDPHAAAVLAQTLYYVNRETFEPNRQSRRIELWQIAAQSGVVDYQIAYAKELFTLARSERAFLFPQAVDALLTAHEGGDPRAAETIAYGLRLWFDDVAPLLAGTEFGADRFAWLSYAAANGLRTASCSYALSVFDPVRSFDTGSGTRADLLSLVNQIYASEDADRVRDAEYHLAECHTPKQRKPQGRRNPAFGEPALYAGRLRGGWTSLANSVGHARIAAGVLYGFRGDANNDPSLAAEFFTLARDEDGFSDAEAFLALLEPDG